MIEPLDSLFQDLVSFLIERSDVCERHGTLLCMYLVQGKKVGQESKWQCATQYKIHTGRLAQED